MVEIFRVVLVVHVAGGLVALILFWTALAQHKGGVRHRRLGRAYVAAMAFTMATALVLAGMAGGWPSGIHPAPPGLGAAAVARHAEGVRGLALFLGGIAAGTLALLWIGWRSVRGAHGRRRLRAHLIGMLGSATAAHTAVVVSVVPRLLGGLYENDPTLNAVPWIVPPLIGMAGISYALRRFGALPIGGPGAPPRPSRA